MTSTRDQILEATLAHLEAERFSPPNRYEYASTEPDPQVPLFPVSRAEAVRNARRLLDALSDDQAVIDLRTRRGA